MDLRQAINRLGEQFWRGMLLVPRLVDQGVAQAEVSAQIHHPAAGGKQVRHHAHGGLVRHGGKDEINARNQFLQPRLTKGERANRGQTGEHGGHRPAGILARGDPPHLDLWMAGENAEQFNPGIAGAAEDCGAYHDRCASSKKGRGNRKAEPKRKNKQGEAQNLLQLPPPITATTSTTPLQNRQLAAQERAAESR